MFFLREGRRSLGVCVCLVQVLNLLRRHYPAHIMPDLQHYSQEAMRDLSRAFPTNPNLKHNNLDRFLEVGLPRHTSLAREHNITRPLSKGSKN